MYVVVVVRTCELCVERIKTIKQNPSTIIFSHTSSAWKIPYDVIAEVGMELGTKMPRTKIL